MRLPVTVAQERDVDNISEIGLMAVCFDPNSWIIFQGLTEHPVVKVTEEGRGECTSLPNAEAILEGR